MPSMGQFGSFGHCTNFVPAIEPSVGTPKFAPECARMVDMSRPPTLGQAAAAALSGDKTFGSAVDEFVDEFYLDHPHRDRQQARIDEAPATIGDALQDAWLGAVGEHLLAPNGRFRACRGVTTE